MVPCSVPPPLAARVPDTLIVYVVPASILMLIQSSASPAVSLMVPSNVSPADIMAAVSTLAAASIISNIISFTVAITLFSCYLR